MSYYKIVSNQEGRENEAVELTGLDLLKIAHALRYLANDLAENGGADKVRARVLDEMSESILNFKRQIKVETGR